MAVTWVKLLELLLLTLVSGTVLATVVSVCLQNTFSTVYVKCYFTKIFCDIFAQLTEAEKETVQTKSQEKWECNNGHLLHFFSLTVLTWHTSTSRKLPKQMIS